MKPLTLLYGCTGIGKLALIGALLLFFGCQSLIFDPRGRMVPEDKWIKVPDAGEQTGVFKNEDLTLSYKMVITSGQLRMSGEVRFADRIAKSFPIIQYFNLGVMLLDDQGKILGISSLTSAGFYSTQSATIPDYPLVFNTPVAFGGAARYIAFHYTGRGLDLGGRDGGGTMDFWEYPVY